VARDWSASLWFLVAVNLIPIVGVLKFGWQVADIVFLYWFENLIIGALNVPRIILAQPEPSRGLLGAPPPPDRGRAGNVGLALFFSVHYGIFCLVHGIFITVLFGKWGDPLTMTATMLRQPAMLAAIASLAASHLFSLLFNYVGSGEYRRVKAAEMMFRPYGRIAVVHFFILAAGFVLLALKSPLLGIVAFVVVKIFVDAAMHRRERALHA
jgi:hypothetical protein